MITMAAVTGHPAFALAVQKVKQDHIIQSVAGMTVKIQSLVKALNLLMLVTNH